MTARIQAYAKINLHLDVSGLREDGFHNVVTVLHSLSLCDVVDIELSEGEDILIECDKIGVPLDEKNIAHKAAKLFFDSLGRRSGVVIRIKKNIPMAAGLAGGSADGAAVLIGLNKIFDEPFSSEELCEIGARLGADVPFCILCGCAYSEGKGDLPQGLPTLSREMIFVVACGGEGVSTPDAYRALDEAHDNFAIPRQGGERFRSLMTALGARDVDGVRAHMYNIFEEIVLPTHSVAGKLIEEMRAHGAMAAMMSGSGPSVFGIFDTEEKAAETAAHIENVLGIPAHVTRPAPKD